jgi:gas vesicle protein
MRDRTGVMIGLMAGAVAGGVVGWLFLTDDGRRFRARIEPHLGALAESAVRLRETAIRAQRAASASVQTWQEVSSRTRPH